MTSLLEKDKIALWSRDLTLIRLFCKFNINFSVVHDKNEATVGNFESDHKIFIKIHSKKSLEGLEIIYLNAQDNLWQYNNAIYTTSWLALAEYLHNGNGII